MNTDHLLQILELKVLGNTLGIYLFALFLFIAAVVILKFSERIIIRRIKKLPHYSSNHLESFAVEMTESRIIPLLYLMAFYMAVTQISLSPELSRFIHAIMVIGAAYHVTQFMLAVSMFAIEEIGLKRQKLQEKAAALRSILGILRIGVWGMGIVFVLDNLGFNVAAVLAGLGIGGIAVALAAQTILGDLFNYFVIFFDKPFFIGDSIVIGDKAGTIEHIGIKTTRLRALSGEQIIMSNTLLTSSQVHNHKRMSERRVLFKLGVTYETPSEMLKEIPLMIRSIIEKIPKTRFDRAHFQSYGDFSLNFEVVYFALTPDYNLHMDIQEQINLAIKEGFDRKKINFAYPTQTVYEHKIPPSLS